MTEQALAFHEYAQIFPMLQDGDLEATGKTDECIVTISPSAYAGYSYIAFVEIPGGACTELAKPVDNGYIKAVLEAMGINITGVKWSVRKHKPLTRPLYAGVVDPQSREPLVYFIEGAGRIKIGVAQDPQSRLDALQTGSPVPLNILAVCEGGYERESELHQRFVSSRLYGEWFYASAELMAFIEEIR